MPSAADRYSEVRGWLFLCALAAALVFVTPAFASQHVDWGATNVRLAVNGKGEALVTYRTQGQTRRVLFWGALNARQPTRGVPQQRFKRDFGAGWGKYHDGNYWRTFANLCRRYDGPALAFAVATCRAPDGSYWALQSWGTGLPDLGFRPWTWRQAAPQLHISHWRGPLAKLDVWTDWIYGGRYHHLFGRYTYDGQPVYGFGTTGVGEPTDGYGRLVFLDTYDSIYGRGWWRENSFVSHNPTGMFCYGFVQYDPHRGYPYPAGWPAGKLRGPGNGSKYRLTATGPGVTPDVSVTVAGLANYDPRNPALADYERRQNALLDSIVGPDRLCRQH